MVTIAKQGLKGRARFSGGMVDERGYLSELEDIADSGMTPAERLLDLYHGDWDRDLSRLYRDFAY
jgi:glutamate--cysteine ligase